MEKKFVVLFGSYLTSRATARDIDVVFGGCEQHEAAQVVREFTKSSLPLDLHKSREDWQAVLPAPCGEQVEHLVIAGSPTIIFDSVFSLPAVLRAGEGDPEKTLKFFEDATKSLNGCTLNLKESQATKTPDWGDYVAGLWALESAMSHSTPEALDALPCAEVVKAIREHRALKPEFATFFDRGTQQGAGDVRTIVFANDGITASYGARKIAYADAMNMFDSAVS